MNFNEKFMKKIARNSRKTKWGILRWRKESGKNGGKIEKKSVNSEKNFIKKIETKLKKNE